MSEILKSASDKKEYQLVTLPSGMEALLVSTAGLPSRSTHAAAACSVQVGSFSDPELVQGLAHFVEHMVFMGSTAYPQENYYDSFVHSHGGDCNAMTEGEFTVYQFTAAAEHLSAALDVFGSALLHPLFTPAAMERELNAIESEFSLALSDDGARLQQLIGVSSVAQHVVQKFSWGNEFSLKTMPEKARIDVNALMRDFHRTHYTPANMKLVLVAPKPLSEIYADVLGTVLNRPFQPATLAHASGGPALLPQHAVLKNMKLPLAMDSFRKVYRVIPTRKTHKLLLTWQLESAVSKYKSKSDLYLSHLIGHEGPGSLLSELKRQGYASGITAGISSGNMDSNSMFSMFNVAVSLTPRGLANWHAVCSVFFAYVGMLKTSGPQPWIYEELREMGDIALAHVEEQDEEEFAETLAIDMLPYQQRARPDLLSSHYLFCSFDPSEIAALNAVLADPTRARIEVLSSGYYMPGRLEREDDDPETEWEDADDDDDDDDGDEEDDEDDLEDEEGEDDSIFNVGGSEDDDDESYIDEGNAEQNVTAEELARMYEGPAQWRHLIVPPTDATVACKVTPEVEPFFGTLYWVDAIPDELIALWASPPACANLKLPPRNRFVPRDFNVVVEPDYRPPSPPPQQKRKSETKSEIQSSANEPMDVSVFQFSSAQTAPQKVFEKDGLVMWHLVHPVFRTPKVEMYFQLSAHLPAASAVHASLNDLLSRVLTDALVETAYMAAMAEIHSSITVHDTGLLIHISGFSDKAFVLLDAIFAAIVNPSELITSERVERQFEVLCRNLINEDMKASKSASNARLVALKPTKYSAEKKLHALQHMQREHVQHGLLSYTKKFLGHVHIESFIVGNVTSRSAIQYCDSLHQTLLSHDLKLGHDAISKQAIVNICGSIPYLLHVIPNNLKERNTAVEAYFQLGAFDIHSLTLLDLLEQIISENFFDELRTKKQLGYNVSCGVRQTYGVLGFCFVVVTSSHPVDEVQNAVLEFAMSSVQYLSRLTAEEYSNSIESLTSHYIQGHNSLSSAATELWSEIEERKYIFDHGAIQASLLQKISAKDVSEFAFRLFDSQKKLLLVHSSVDERLEHYLKGDLTSLYKVLAKAEDLVPLSSMYFSV